MHPFRHPLGAANQTEISATARRAERADVEQTKKIVPFVTGEVSFCQYVCDLVFDVNIDSVKQPIQSNSVGSWRLIVGLLPLIIILMTASLSSNTYNIATDWELLMFKGTLSIWNNSELSRLVGALVLILPPCAWRDAMPQVSLCWWILGFIGLVLGRMEHFYDQVPKIQSWDTVHP